MNPYSEYRKTIDDKGISLQCFGINDVALSREDAIFAVGLLQSASIPILGGDVYCKKPSGIESAYANWHSDRLEGEDRNSFASRSCFESLNYIENFPSMETSIFVLVIDL